MIEAEDKIRGKRVLVTGAAGFIGSRLVKALLACDAEVVALVDEGSRMDRIESLLADPRLHLICCDVADVGALAAQKQKWGNIDLLAHLGWRVPHATSYCGQAIEDITLNLLPTMNVIRALGDSVRGVCFASSVAVYGNPNRLTVREDDLPCPITSYGATKLAIENYLRTYGQVSQVPVTILRYAIVYGSGEFGHRAIPNFLQNLSKGQPPLVYGDGSEIRDYVYLDDVVQATILALLRKPARVLNIGSGEGYTSLHIARELIRLYSADMEPQFFPREEEGVNITCNISAAKEVLGYYPQTSLEEGLMQEIEWYRREVMGRPLALFAERES